MGDSGFVVAHSFLECDDLSSLWSEPTCRLIAFRDIGSTDFSDDKSPLTKSDNKLSHSKPENDKPKFVGHFKKW